MTASLHPRRLLATLGLLAAVGPASVLVARLSLPLVARVAADPSLATAEGLEARLGEVIDRPEVAAAVLLPVQALLLVLAVLIAWRDRRGLRAALGLCAPRIEGTTFAFALLGMPALQVIGGLSAFVLLGEPNSEHLDVLERMFTVPRDTDAVWILLMGTVVPGVAEELLFRGVVLRRLLADLRPWLAIGLTAVAFAALHLDAHQAVGVLPIGLYLGLVAWRSGSVWPAIVLHAANNAWAAHLARTLSDPPDPRALAGSASLALAAFLPLGLALWRLVRPPGAGTPSALR